MQATDSQGSSATIGRSILRLRREQVYAVDGGASDMEVELEIEVESFQKKVVERLSSLATVESEDLVSLGWIRKLLDSFLSCQEEFRALLYKARSSHVQGSPRDRFLQDFFERSVKALDVCNAIRDGIEQIREWNKFLEIVLVAFDSAHGLLAEAHFRRAKKALLDLAISMLDDKDSSSSSSVLANRNRSFGRHHAAKDPHHNHNKALGHLRSLSWSVSRSWSAARQLQALGNNLVAPKANEVVATSGVAVAVFTMSSVLLFVMWVLVAAIPCQDRGLQVHFSIPRQFPWAASILSLHERILEESRRRDRRNACGLMREIYRMDNCARVITELADNVQFPVSDEKEREVRQRVDDLKCICEGFKEGLDPLERQVREVFHGIVRSRTEGIHSLGRPNHHG